DTGEYVDSLRATSCVLVTVDDPEPPRGGRQMRLGIVLVILLALCSCGDYGTGEKIGTVIKLASQGVFCHTWEGTLIRGGMQGGSGAFGTQPFEFTVEDSQLLPQIQEALNGQYEIKLYYHAELMSFCRSDGDSHFVT